ncbi:MAG: cell division protein ZapA [Bacteroidaceae bacterium]|nr:cell division protein ZapA [Bacteroidaceae bacterium]
MEVSDTFQIRLKLGSTTFPITIRRADEQLYRDAEKLINQRYAFYANKFPHQTSEIYLMMSTIEIAVRLQVAETTGNLQPVMATLNGLIGEVESALK